MIPLHVGSPAPPFSLVGSDGGTYDLSRLCGTSLVLLIFYPGNDTPG